MQRQLDPVRVMGRSGLAFQGCSWDHRGVMGELQCKSWTRKRHHDGTRWNALLWTVWIMALAVALTGVEEVGGDPATDAVVMASLKAGITSLNLLPGRWSGSDPCLWHGVYCDSFNSVIRINISQLTLTGTVTRDIHKLTSLASLELGNNAFTGPLPTLQGMANLTLAEFFGNNFESIPTDFFDGLVSIRVISLTLNPLNDWRLPSSMNDAASTLEEFYAWCCGLVGELPSYLGTMPALKVLDLHNSSLSGSVPASFKNSGIQQLDLYNLYDQRNTGLTGGIDFVGGMANLTELILSGNGFAGPVPDGIVNATGLTSIYLDGNQLVGRLPQGLSALSNLDRVDLYGNYLSGELPPFGSGVTVNATVPGQNSTFCGDRGVRCSTKVDALLDFLAAVDFPQEIAKSWVGADPCAPLLWTGVSCNPLTGDVISIDLRNSSLAGTLSPSLGNLKSLTVLDLSGNALTGPIPQQLTFLTNLKTLDVSDNNLSGSLPPFDSSVRVIYTPGNPLLNRAPPPAMAPPVVPSTVVPSTAMSKKSIVIVVAVLGGIVLCSLVFSCFYIKSRTRNTSLLVYGSHHSAGQAPELWNKGFTIDQLKAVTENFADHNVLGRGGFSVVYKGVLADGTKIAVKRMEAAAASSKGLSEFQSEIAVLTKVRHRHLVDLLGFCTDGTERLLVYEYMPQGTLSHHLFKYRETTTLMPLSWTTRLLIALDVAQAVEYLHGLMHQSFIHRDLKPSNVLLTDDLRAKVADFGLVKVVPEGNLQSMETRVAGTFGYLAPEYAATGRLTTKADVFSFGVILMELLTGRRAVDGAQSEEDVHLVTWFTKIMRTRSTREEVFMSAMDPAIGGRSEDEAMFKSLTTVAELAWHCTAREPLQRPDMGHVVSVLRPLVAEWKPVDTVSQASRDTDVLMFAQALTPWQESEDGSTTDRTGTDTSTEESAKSLPARPVGLASSFAAFAHSR